MPQNWTGATPETGPDKHLSLLNRSARDCSAEVEPSFRLVSGSALCLQNSLPMRMLSSLPEVLENTINQQFDHLPPALKSVVLSLVSKQSVDPESAHEVLATNCFRMMDELLRPNICGILLPGTDRSTIPGDVIKSYIPEPLVYACNNWVTHVKGTGVKETDNGRVLKFLQSHFLHWLEVLSLTGNAAESIHMVQALKMTLHHTDSKRLSEFLKDALQLLSRNMSIIDLSPLQVYSSLLLFASQENTVATSFKGSIPCWIPLQPEREALEDDSRQIFEGHEDSITSSVFSPDASLIASASEDCTVRIWRVSDGECLHKLVGHKDEVLSVTFFPASDIVITGSLDKSVKLWSIKDGRCIRSLRGHYSVVEQVTVSPDGRFITFCSSLDKDSGSGKIWTWLVPERKYLYEWQGHWGTVHCVGVSSDSELVAFGADDGLIYIWRVKDGVCLHTLKGHEDSVQSVIFAPDLSYLASGSGDGTVRIWNFAEEQCQQVFDCRLWVYSISVSPDSKQIAFASSKNGIQIWDVEQARCEYELTGHNSDVRSIMFSPDGKLLVSGSDDFTVRVWSATAPLKKQKLNDKFHELGAIIISPDQFIIASAELAGSIKLWDFREGGMIRELRAAGCDSLLVDEFRFSPDGKLLLVLGYSPGSVGWLWSVDDGECIHDFTEHEWSANHAAFLRDSKTVIIGCVDYVIRRWNIEDGFMEDLVGHESAISVVSVSDSDIIACGDYGGIVRLWDPLDGTVLHKLHGPEGETTTAVFSQGGELLAISYPDNTIRIWNTKSGSCTKVLTSTDEIGSVAFAPDSSFLASTHSDDTVRLWSIEDGTCLHARTFPRVGSCDIEFDGSGSQLVFDAGQLSIEGLGAVDSAIELVDTGFALSKDSRWVTWRGNKILWLPSSVHPSCWLIRGSTVAIGCTSGMVIVIRFGDVPV